MTDQPDLLACPTCPARGTEPCYRLTSGGPEALPPAYADRPHPGRKQAATPRAAKAQPLATAGTKTKPTARRSAARSATTAAAWQALAAKQRTKGAT